jgi:ABC-type Zn uptake system ZnuABC Zn-binding protein ZnuA
MKKFTPAILTCLLAFFCGCGQQQNENIVIKVDPLASVKTMLQGYVNGQPLRSEVTSFPDYVATMKKVDPAKAEILEKGFAEIQKPGTNIQAKAKEILSKIE